MDGLLESSISILCVPIAGLIPFISKIDQAKAEEYLLRMMMSLLSSSWFNEDKIMTGFVEFSPKKAYQRWSGSCFRTNPSLVVACLLWGELFV